MLDTLQIAHDSLIQADIHNLVLQFIKTTEAAKNETQIIKGIPDTITATVITSIGAIAFRFFEKKFDLIIAKLEKSYEDKFDKKDDAKTP